MFSVSLASHASIEERDFLKPDWARPSWDLTQENPNCSFLTDVHHSNRVNPLADVIDKSAMLEMKQKFQDVSRDYELKSRYGLVDRFREQQRADEVHNFGREIFGEVRRYQTSKQANHLKKAVEREPGLQPFLKPAAVVGVGAAVYSGQPVNVKIDDDTRLRAVTNVPNQTGNLSLSSPIVNTAVDVDMSDPDPNAPPVLDPTKKAERCRVSLSRGLPVWDLTTGVSYGASTSSVGASLSKSLNPHLTAVVDSTRYMQPGSASSEESLKFFYGLQF